MGKKSKKVKIALDASSEDTIENKSVNESETTPKKKKKKVRLDKENAEDRDLVENNVSEGDVLDKEENVKSNTEDFDNIGEVNGHDKVEVKAPLSKKQKKKLEKLTNGGNTTLSNGEQMAKKDSASNVRSSKQRLKDDNAYICDFLAALHIPNHKKDGEEDDDIEEEEGGESKEEKEKRVKPGGTTRATTSQELRDRLQAKLEELRGRKLGVNESRKQKKMKRKLASIEKKKVAEEEMKQKLMTIGKNAGNLNKVINKEVEQMGAKLTKPGVKTEKGVVFSKFDFKDEMAPKEAKKTLDPQAALNKIKKSKEKIKLWEEKGKTDKAKNIENKIAWENALGKAQGEKIKDDEFLLKKAIKKKKQIKNSSKKKWEARAEGVKNKEAAFIEKREGNMAKRKKEKKDKKMKLLVAKGRHVPGS